MTNNFDIVIPLGPNEFKNFGKQLTYVKQNVIGYRNIYIVTNTETFTETFPDCTMIDEKIFPFSMSDIAQEFSKFLNKCNRNGWYLQQLIKLYSGFAIPNILPNYLVIDADVFFLKPLHFISNGGKFIFTTGTEFYEPYFEHMLRMHPSLKKMILPSGIAHHMIYNKDYVQELMNMVEEFHDLNTPFHKLFYHLVTEHNSGASEYEMYFNFMLQFHPNLMEIRQLKWTNVDMKHDLIRDNHHDYVSLCFYRP